MIIVGIVVHISVFVGIVAMVTASIAIGAVFPVVVVCLAEFVRGIATMRETVFTLQLKAVNKLI